MSNDYSADALLGFLDHAAARGLMPAATAQALAVACRSLFQVLDEAEKTDLRTLDLDDLIARFNNVRAHDFNPSSLREYGRRLKRAVGLFVSWRDDPAGFAPKTRSSGKSARRASSRTTPAAAPDIDPSPDARDSGASSTPGLTRGYSTSFPVRNGVVVTLMNVPADLKPTEAERLADFVRMLAVA